MSSQSLEEFLFPPVQTVEQARKAARQGMWAALFVAGFTAFFFLLAWRESSPLDADPVGYVQIAIFVVLAWYIRLMSRAAAIIALFAFIAERMYSAITYGMDIKLGSIVLLIFFVNAIRGTYAYYRLTNSPTSATHAA